MREALYDEGEARLLEQLETSARVDAARFAEDADRLVELAVLSRRLFGADGVERYLSMDVAGTLRVGQQAAARRLSEAERLHTALPRTLARLRTGRLLVPQASVLLHETGACSDAVAADAERRVLAGLDDEALKGLVGLKLVRRVKRAVLEAEAALEPALTAERESEARRGRRVQVRPEPDGMGSLWALLPAEQLRTFALGFDELDRRQAQADRAAGLDRTADQRRADTLALLPALALHALDGTVPSADGSHPAVVVQVHVPMATALGLSDAPGHLEGYGPVSAGSVRLMLPSARLRRVVVDELTGEPVHVEARTRRVSTSPAAARGRNGSTAETAAEAASTGTAAGSPEAAGTAAGPAARTGPLADGALRRSLLAMLDSGPLLVQDVAEPQYEPSAGLARLVRVRDAHCTGVGCDRESAACDLDHGVPWPLGPTSAANLATVSRRCHGAKTISWGLQRHRDGSSTWTSPTSRRYTTPPPWSAPPDVDGYRPEVLPEDQPSRWGATSWGAKGWGTPPRQDDPEDVGLTACLDEAVADSRPPLPLPLAVRPEPVPPPF